MSADAIGVGFGGGWGFEDVVVEIVVEIVVGGFW